MKFTLTEEKDELSKVFDMDTMEILQYLDMYASEKESPRLVRMMINELMDRHKNTISENTDDENECVCNGDGIEFREEPVYDASDLVLLDTYILGQKDMAKCIHREITSMLNDRFSLSDQGEDS